MILFKNSALNILKFLLIDIKVKLKSYFNVNNFVNTIIIYNPINYKNKSLFIYEKYFSSSFIIDS